MKINTAKAKLYQASRHRLGDGTYSFVQLGKELATNKLVALKYINYSNYSEQDLENLHNEITILKKIAKLNSNENFVKIIDVINSGSEVCLVTELIEGGELHDYCLEYANFMIPERICKWIFLKLLKAVGNLHDNKICHLDIKIENVMYNKTSHQVKLIDFGFSKEIKGEEKQRGFCGSCHYVPPEIIKKRKYDGRKADVWSLGVTLFLMLTGDFPYPSMKPETTIHYPTFLSTDAISLLQSMLTKNPNERASISALVSHPWFSVQY